MLFRESSIMVRTLLCLLAFLFLSGDADAGSFEYSLHEARLSPTDFVSEKLTDGSLRVSVTGGRALQITGEPDLPALDLLFLVPAHLAITDVRIEPLAVRTETLAGPLAKAAPLLTSTGQPVSQRYLEPLDGMFPARWGMFSGLHDWRGFRLLAVTVFPVRALPATATEGARLEFLEHYAIAATVAADRQLPPPLARQRQVAGERQALEGMLQRLVVNPGAISGYQRDEGVRLDKSGAPFLPTPNPSLEGSGVRYLIVTTEALAGEFQALADRRTAQGLPAKVVTREWIEATQRHGIDFQETLRLYLQQAYAKWGIEFMLVGGDTDVIPTRYVRSYLYGSDGQTYTDIPTDLYYACLDGNWNANGNGWLAEPYTTLAPGDDADLAPELAVGRVTVRSALDVQRFVDKVVAYETVPAGDSYPDGILYAAEVLHPSPWTEGQTIVTNGAQYAHELNSTIVQACTDMTALRMYQTDQNGLYPKDMDLTLAGFIQQVNSGNYGHVVQIGHGHYFNMSISNVNFTVTNAAALTNAPNFFLLYTVNCSSAAFDKSCLMEAFVENPNGGSIASIGSARVAFPATAAYYMYEFYQALTCNGVPRPGKALNTACLNWIAFTYNNSFYRWTVLNTALLGDPALGVWNGSPRPTQLAAPAQVTAGEQTVLVTVTAAGVPVPGADVCLAKAGETYARDVTDIVGNAWLDVIPQTAGDLVLTVAGAGLALTTQPISVAGGSTYISLQDIVVSDSTGNSNGLPEAGETLSLQLSLRDVGGGGATGVSLSVTSDHPDLVVLAGSATADDIPPGGTVAANDPIVVQAAASMPDGTSARLRVAVSAATGGPWISQGEIEILAPEPQAVQLVVDDSVYGNANGIAESGERLVLRPYVKNYGAGRLDQLLVEIVDGAPGVEVHSAMALISGLASLAEATYQFGELSLTLDDIGMPAPARLTFLDNHDRSFEVSLEFNPPPPPPLPVADATLGADAIALRWDPVGEGRTLGYHVYRAMAAEGPFVRANQDLLRGVSYFEDRPLEPLTYYWYRVAAVDTFLIEGDFSPTVAQDTKPAEISNFPLRFATPTSSHCAVGDVTGDGRLEVVLAADELYVWHNDGTELRDGDGDAQSTGPFTNFDGAFSPAGVVLAQMDGQPGLEMIVSQLSPNRRIHIFRHDGSQLPGWPRTLRGHWNYATPAVGDVTGDGFNEVVVNDLGGRTFVWRHDGTELRDGDNNPATDGVFVVRPESWGFSAPVLYDLDGDGACEIIFGTSYDPDPGNNALLAYKADGSQAPGFPFYTGIAKIICTPVIADLDRDGSKEIIFATAVRRLYVLRADGSLYPGFPLYFPGTTDYGAGPSPAVGNFDDDDDFEILWPVNGGGTRMDLLLVDTGLHDSTSGQIMTGWPIQLSSNTEGSPVVGDINGDGRVDIIQPTENGYIHAFNADGTVIAGFPIFLNSFCRTAPVICDFNGDGNVNLVYGSSDNLLHVWSLPYAYDPTLMPWPTMKGNNQRTGVAHQVSVTAVTDPQVPAAFTLLPPYPNPFNPATTLRLYVAPAADPRLEVGIFDLRGRRVRNLHNGAAEPGWRTMTWDGRDDAGRQLASGVYFVQARQADRVQTFKLALIT